MEDAGAAAVVMHSLFEEQLRQDRHDLHHHLLYGSESYAEALTYFPEPVHFRVGPQEYLEHLRRAKERIQIPVIASLNGSTLGGWTSTAKLIEQAGADGLELNVYAIPTDLDQTGAEIEQLYCDIFTAVKAELTIPVAFKLSPYVTNLANLAHRLDQAGVDGLVLLNRFYQPDINLKTLEVEPNVLLSTPHAMRLPLRWIAILYGRVRADLAATSGIHKGQDALKMVMAGANITMLCSVLLRHGIDQIRIIEQEMRTWMEQHEYTSARQMQGSMSQQHCPDPSAFERAHYMRSLQAFEIHYPATVSLKES
jgi:dihydroorotate dehydrogenase (fumarate)